jgi:hypothetical protein
MPESNKCCELPYDGMNDRFFRIKSIRGTLMEFEAKWRIGDGEKENNEYRLTNIE